MTDYRHLMDLPAGARTAQPFIEKKVDAIVGRFASAEEVKRFAEYIPPLLRHFLEISVTALGGYLTIHRKKLPKGFAGDLMWVALNRAIDQAASKFGENIAGAGEEPAQKGEKAMAEESTLAFDEGKDFRKLHLLDCPELRPERDETTGKKGNKIPPLKHKRCTVERAKAVGLIGADGKVAAKYACDNCKDAIAKLGASASPKKSKTAAQPQFAPAPPTIGAAIMGWITPRDKPSNGAEILADNAALRQKLYDAASDHLTYEEYKAFPEFLEKHLGPGKEQGLKELTLLVESQDEDQFRGHMKMIRSKFSAVTDELAKKLGLEEAKKQAGAATRRLEDATDYIRNLRDRFRR